MFGVSRVVDRETQSKLTMMNPPANQEAPFELRWSEDKDPGIGGSEYSIQIKDGQINWSYTEDRWGRSGRQSLPDFAEFGPLWQPPDGILAELIAHLNVSDCPWQKPGHVDYSPIWWALEWGKQDEALALLIPLDATRRYHGQRTLLMQAALKNAPRIVEQLLAAGADAKAQDEYGRTALREACAQLPPPLPTMRLLLEHGANINAVDENGKTPLIAFCSSMNPSLDGLQLLLDHGANVRARDHDNLSALDRITARRYLGKELSDLLRKTAASTPKPGVRPVSEIP